MNQPPLPPWKEPVEDGSGVMTSVWRTYFEALHRYIAELETRLAALEP